MTFPLKKMPVLKFKKDLILKHPNGYVVQKCLEIWIYELLVTLWYYSILYGIKYSLWVLTSF